MLSKEILEKAAKIKLVVTDVDGVLTDTGTYYTADGEMMKRFSIRDGMGVERLRSFAEIETAIITGENTEVVTKRAQKLKIKEVHLGVKNKVAAMSELVKKLGLDFTEIAYIGDDTNDTEVMRLVGLSACPSDATSFAKNSADIIVESPGGHGAFRDLAEIIIASKAFIKE